MYQLELKMLAIFAMIHRGFKVKQRMGYKSVKTDEIC